MLEKSVSDKGEGSSETEREVEGGRERRRESRGIRLVRV